MKNYALQEILGYLPPDAEVLLRFEDTDDFGEIFDVIPCRAADGRLLLVIYEGEAVLIPLEPGEPVDPRIQHYDISGLFSS